MLAKVVIIYDRNSLFRITLQVFLDRFVEREIQSLFVHCIHQEEGCDWKDELRKRKVINKLLHDVQISRDVYPLPALLARAVPVRLICSCKPCHLFMIVPRSLEKIFRPVLGLLIQLWR